MCVCVCVCVCFPHLRDQQGEFAQPVVEVLAVRQAGLDQGAAVGPAHHQPHGVVGHCREPGRVGDR